MNPTANRLLTVLTAAGLVGLLIFNWRASNTLLGTAGTVANNYVRTVQGR